MKMLLYIGCGLKQKEQTTVGFDTPEWTEIRLDIDASVQPDAIGTMTDMSSVDTGTMDAIFATTSSTCTHTRCPLHWLSFPVSSMQTAIWF